MGRCEPLLDFRNVSSAACMLPAATTVRALDRQGRLMGVEHPKAEKPLVLEPGEFGEYISEIATSDPDEAPPPSMATWYEFRFADGDAEALRMPGAEEVSEGPRAAFSVNDPAPDLSRVARERRGVLTLSAYLWPPPAPAAGPQSDLLEADNREGYPTLGSLHVSLANAGPAASAGWDGCQIIVDAREEPGGGGAGTTPAHLRSHTGCQWNGDIASGTIAAGATVAMEVDTSLPKICHRSRYDLTVWIEGGPVSFAPLVALRTRELQPLCSDSRTASSPVAQPVSPPGPEAAKVQWGVPYGGINIGAEMPARETRGPTGRSLRQGDPAVVVLWVDNELDQPLHFAGTHGFHLRLIRESQPFRPAPDIAPRSGSNDTGPIDIDVPAHTRMSVAVVDLGTMYDLSAESGRFLFDAAPLALTGKAAALNWNEGKKNPFRPHALLSITIDESHPDR
ncbi:MAG: hypothetical protein WB622_14650 [Acidobacteriaceae bacterium]